MSRRIEAFALHARLAQPYEQVVERVTGELKREGFGVLTTIDVRATLRNKLGQEFRKYVILGACNPELSHRALEQELELGILLPCNVVVYEEDGDSVVSIMDPLAVFDMIGNPALHEIAEEVHARMERVLAALCA